MPGKRTVIMTQARWVGEFPDPNHAARSQVMPSYFERHPVVAHSGILADFSYSKHETLAKSRFWNRYGVERLEILDFL